MIPGAEEIGKTTRSFFDALKDQPLSLALVAMNFMLMFFLFYSGSARKDTVNMIIAWQEKTDQLMANCVSKEVLESVVGALERQLQEMRRQLNGGPKPDPVPVPVPRPPEPKPEEPKP
jgi:hypothetical protein